MPNDCHDAQDGRFCETHGRYHSDEDMPSAHDLWMEGKKKRDAAKKKMNKLSLVTRVLGLQPLRIEEFYNQCHAEGTGEFCEAEGVYHPKSGGSEKRKRAPGYKGSGERKKEGSGYHPASDYAYVPDGDDSSGWKLRLTDKPGGKPSAKITAGAAQALSPEGFRGHKVQIPEKALPAVKAKVRAAWLAARPGMTAADLPDSLKE